GDGDGRTVAQGLPMPGHLGSFPDALGATLKRFGHRMKPGDIYCLNDPFEGGMQLPDVFILKPIFYRDERIAFAGTVCHQTDMGGRVAGSNASDSTETYQEGLRIPPVKMYDGGEPNETLFRLIEKNVRVPVRVFGDMRAQLSACHIAEAAFLRLVETRGAETVKGHMHELMEYTERMTRAALRELPDGEWSFEDWIDDDGIDYGKPIRLFVTLRKSGDTLVADWTGSSPQVKGAINNTLSYTKAATYTGIKSVLPAEIPNNDGFHRAVQVIAPPGTIANCVLPAATAARGLTGFRMVDCVFGALAMMLPDRVFAASDGGSPRRPSVNIINPHAEHRVVPAKVTMTITRGDVYRHELPDGGGWGDPLERDPAGVLRDVLNELVSVVSAHDDYGVVIDTARGEVDAAATARRRADIRATRAAGWPPVVNRARPNGH